MYAIISAVSPLAISSVSIAHFSYSSGLPNDPNAARPRGRATCRPRGFQIQRFPDASAGGRGTAGFPDLISSWTARRVSTGRGEIQSGSPSPARGGGRGVQG